MSRSRRRLGPALVLILSAFIGSNCERRLHQIADAPAPSGSLRSNEKQAESDGALSTVCKFSIQGTPPGAVAALSLDESGSGGSSLTGANITCRGKQLQLIGGPLLEPFSAGWQGVQYQQMDELPGATMVISDTDVAIEDSVFSGLSFFGNGALVVASSNVTFLNVTFSSCNNSAAGAIYANDTSNITVLDSLFSLNGGGQGGAISLWNSSVLVNGTAFYRNRGNGAGGAISARNSSTVEIITSSFTENQAENGGAIYLEMCGKAAMADNTFTSNRANKQGGGIFQTKCSGATRTSYFKLNVAQNGASIWQNDCRQVSHVGSRFDNNTATRGSSGIEMNQITQADVAQCTFTTGRALKGAGLYLQGVSGTVKQCLFDENTAVFGGAIFRGSTDGDIIGNVFEANNATRLGGAIYDSHAKGDISGNTFVSNSAPQAAAIYRTVSSGDVHDNKRLEDSQVEIDNPASN